MKELPNAQPRYILIAEDVLPEVFEKVLKAKVLLERGSARNISDAVRQVELSRSAFYKYKDKVFPARSAQNIVTLQTVLVNEPGTLQNLLAHLSEAGADVVTIHQQKPKNDEAQVTLTVNTAHMKESMEIVMARLRPLPFIKNLELSED